MTEFLFFRHGETDWNLKRIFQGHTDIRLNETGLKQAQSLAQKIQHWKPDIVLCSDLTRALQTAQASEPHWRVPILQSPLLREMHLGKAEGLHRDEVIKLVGPSWEKWVSPKDEDENFRFPEGESKAEAKRRVLDYLERFTKENPKFKKIVVSTHGGVIRRVTHALEGTPEDGVPIPNCVTYRLDWDGWKWNYVPVRERASTVVVHDDKILTFFAIDPFSKKEYHFLPGGLIEPDESPTECGIRETFEETSYSISVVPHDETIREYDFTWNNKKVWCRTHFLKGHLLGAYHEPKVVQDADYNKGVRWVPVEDLNSYFHYDESILNSIRCCLQF